MTKGENMTFAKKIAASAGAAGLERFFRLEFLRAFFGQLVAFAHQVNRNKPAADALARVSGQKDEEIRLGDREIFVHFPSGMGRSKLKIPAARTGTARNMNTASKLAAMAAELVTAPGG